MVYFEFTPAPDANCCQMNRFFGGNPLVFDHPVLFLQNASLEAVNTVVGNADEPMWVFLSANAGVLTSAYYPNSGTHVIYNDPGPHLLPNVFAKKGNRFYGVGTQAPFVNHIVVYDAQAGGAFLADWSTLAAFGVGTINATATRLVCLCTDLMTGASSIKKLSLVDGSIMESIDITATLARFALLPSTTTSFMSVKRRNVLPTEPTVFVGRASPTFSVFGGNGMFSGGVFWYGQSGAGDANVQIYKIVIPCPDDVENPLIASISTGSTVAAGSPINVTWADILDPTTFDVISLRPAPTGGALGFTGASLANLSTGGLAAGTLPFTIPGPTTPGNYIFQLCRDSGSILISTSNVFAVT
jgi:hypothetical protein